MPTRTIALKPSETSAEISRATHRVPLEALQMLTQSVSKCDEEYIRPLPFKVLQRRDLIFSNISLKFDRYRVLYDKTAP